jgi:hypothetical protein
MIAISFSRKNVFIAVAASALLTISSEAFASSFNTQVWWPGITCWANSNPGVGSGYGGFLGNWSGSTQTFWCPIWLTQGTQNVANASGGPSGPVYIDVTSGWATTSSCAMQLMQSPTEGYFVNPSEVNHNSAGYDTVVMPEVYGDDIISGDFQCSMPNGQELLDYNYRQFFDQL